MRLTYGWPGGGAGRCRNGNHSFAMSRITRSGGEAVGRDVVGAEQPGAGHARARSEEHTSELQSLMRISYAVFCLKKKKLSKHQKAIYNLKHTSNSPEI